MTQHGPEFDSLFRFIVVVSQRAEQLINGARVRSETRHVKPTLQALDDVNAGMVGWRVLTQEELDAQRQAIVEQFRAEVGADRIPAETSPRLRDVLPTRPVEARVEPVAAEPEERDDELSRLQRLLGLGDRGREAVVDEEQEGEEVELALDTEEEGGFALDLDEAEPVLDDDTGEGDDFGESEEEGEGEEGFLDDDAELDPDDEEAFIEDELEPDADEN